MASAEEDFPRGGTAKKSTDGKPVVHRGEVDNLFQSNEQAELKKKRKGALKDDAKNLKKQKTGKEKSDGLALNAAAKCVEILHLKNLKEGMLMLGCVKDVADFEVTVSLPCGLQGFLNIRNVSDSYTKLLSEQLDSADTEDIFSLPHLFSPGMVIRCVIAKLDVAKGGSLSIQLSVNPKLVNKALTSSSVKAGMVLSGCVESVEDHGCIIDIGISGSKAFLSKAADKQNNLDDLKVGQFLTCKVEEVKNEGRVLRLSVNPLTVAQASAKAEQGWNLTNLLPGLLVKATIKKVTKHGLILDFLSSFSGQVDFLHMEPEQASNYKEGTELYACVLYVEQSTRLVGLSLRSFLVQHEQRVNAAPSCGDRIGDVVKDCKMTTVHHMSGAMLELPDEMLAFVHRNHMKELNKPTNENRVLAKPEHTCRILDFSPMDQIHFASLRWSVIERPFYRYHDLQAGQIVEGKVSVLLTHGMVVHLSDHIKGLVPRTHLSDILLKNPEKKYIEGMKVKCRVLSVDPVTKKLYLTRKKALVESSLPLFLTFNDARPGCISQGYIVCIKSFGCIVRFYNNVKGLVPISELSSEPIISPEEVFYIGQVVKAKVLKCDPGKEKMVLSFKIAVEGGTEAAAKLQDDCEVGKQLEAKVLKKLVNGLEVSILPDEIRAVLPTMHLSDHMSNCPLLWESLQEGDAVSNLVCFSNNKQISLTKKPTVRWALEEGLVAKDFSEITVGMQLIGWVKNIMSYGVFVEFPYGLVGLAPKSAMTNKFVSDTAAAFQLGQTVIAKVTNLDEEKRRFLVTLKISEVIPRDGDAQTRLINGLQERRALNEVLSMKDNCDLRQQLTALCVGQTLMLTVDTVNGDGATFKSHDLVSATVLANKYHVTGVSLTEGQKVTAAILHVDVLSASVHVSVLPNLVGKKKSLIEGSKHRATVQYVDKDFAVVLLDNTAKLTVIQTRSHLNEVLLSESEKLKAGMNLAIEVTEPSCQELQGLPLVSWQRAAPKRQRTTSVNQQDSKGHCFGETLAGKVRSVKPVSIQVTLEDGSTGSVHVSEVMEVDNVCQGSFPTSSVKVGSAVTARVIGGREAVSNRFLPFSHPKFSYTIPELTLIPSKLDQSSEFKQVEANDKLNSYTVGEEITCFVSKYNPKRKLLEVTTDPRITGTVDLLAMITDPKDASHPEKLYKLGQAIRATVVEKNSKPRRFGLSLTGVHKLEEGSVALGMVTHIQSQELVVKLPFGGKGYVAVTELADGYRPQPLDAYSKDQLLRCFLIACENDKWQLSLRPSRLNPQQAKLVKDPEVLSIDQLKEGQILRGYVKSVGEQGVFIRLSRHITGRAQLQQSTKYFVSNHKVLSEHLPLNTLLTTKIFSIDREEGFINLSLLPEDTGKPDILPESLRLPLRLIGEEKKKYDAAKKKRTLSESEQKQAESVVPKKKKKTKKAKGDDNDSGVEVYFREEEDQEAEQEPKPDAAKPVTSSSAAPSRLQVAAGFSWDVGLSSLKPASAAQDGDSSDGEDQDGSSKPQKKSRHELEQEKKATEKALVQREVELMDPNLRPEDAAAFERLLLASPNSSLLWLQYMAHHLQATQIEQARAVAERALKTISFREEQEKLNVWVALLNLENMYGTQETLKKVFERALQFCEPMPVYQQLADIYAKSDKTKEAEGLYKTMVKRFRQIKTVWLSFGSFLLQQGQSDAAAALLQRALKSLPSKESVDVIAKFAQLEFRFGDVEKGRTMLDKVLTSYPKRTDLWSVFIDLMIKHGSQKEVRVLFDRVIHLSVSVKKIKFFFKRYLEYEKKHGTPQSIQAVKEKAMEFVEAKGTEAAN